MNISFLNEGGHVKIDNALENLTQAVVASKEISTDQKEQALELLEAISGQAALSEQKRLKSGTIRTLFAGLANTMSAAGGLAEVWTTWGPAIKTFFAL